MMPENQDTMQVEWLLPDGSAGGRSAKGTFRVRGPLPGDRITPGTTRQKGRTLSIESYELVDRGPRVPHPCPVLEACGGCDLGGLPDRSALLLDLVTRGIQHPATWVDSPRPQGHRARLRLGVEAGQLGFRQPRSHTLVPIDTCPAARPELNEALAALGPVQGATQLELRTDGTRVVACLDAGSVTGIADIAMNGRRASGDPSLTLQVAGHALRVSPRSFFQANLEVNELLVTYVLEALAGSERVLDLCAGIGNFSVPLAARGIGVVAVELEGQATADLKHNATVNGVQIEVHTRAVERFDPTRSAFDAVLLDPPRAGCPGVVDKLLLQRPRSIVYVSCHLPSATRDLRPALEQGYSIEAVTVFDMFPDTHHTETVITLRR